MKTRTDVAAGDHLLQRHPGRDFRIRRSARLSESGVQALLTDATLLFIVSARVQNHGQLLNSRKQLYAGSDDIDGNHLTSGLLARQSKYQSICRVKQGIANG